jgi:methylated-DNA-[protein]-cysteine S-methyltransferase
MDARSHSLTVDTPIGALTVTETGGAITRVAWLGDSGARATDETPVLLNAAHQLDAYFFCELKAFDLPLAPEGSDFQKAVWDAMLAIPFGATRTYGEIAADLGGAAQAVGTACGRNPIPVIIPCHRIVGAGDWLGGYSGAGGVATKEALLRHEGWPGPAQGSLFGAA